MSGNKQTSVVVISASARFTISDHNEVGKENWHLSTLYAAEAVQADAGTGTLD